MERGPDNVRVDDIAEAAGVATRTYDNYFSSREQAIVAAVTAERALRIAAAPRDRPAAEPLATAVVEAVVEQDTTEFAGDELTLITTTARLRAEFVDAVTAIRQPLASAIADRIGGSDTLAPAVLAAAVSGAARVAVEQWVRPSGDTHGGSKTGGFVVVTGERPLADLLRATLAHVVPALAAADQDWTRRRSSADRTS